MFANSSPELSVTGMLELTVANKRNPGYVSDYVKLAKQTKLRLNQLIYLGLTRPLVLIFWYKIRPKIFMNSNSIHRFVTFWHANEVQSFYSEINLYKWAWISFDNQWLPWIMYFNECSWIEVHQESSGMCKAVLICARKQKPTDHVIFINKK